MKRAIICEQLWQYWGVRTENVSRWLFCFLCTHTQASRSSSTLRSLWSGSSSWSREARSSGNTRGALNSRYGQQVSIASYYIKPYQNKDILVWPWKFICTFGSSQILTAAPLAPFRPLAPGLPWRERARKQSQVILFKENTFSTVHVNMTPIFPKIMTKL